MGRGCAGRIEQGKPLRIAVSEKRGLTCGEKLDLGAAQKWQSCGLLSALRRSVRQAEPAKPSRKPKKATGQKEMLLPIEAKKPKEASAKTTAAKPERKR